MQVKHLILLAVILTLNHSALAEDVDVMTSDATREAYVQPLPVLPEADRLTFFKGRNLVRQSWVIPPSENPNIAGLGPLYNRISCIACHPGNGRGFAPNTANEPMRSMLVRLSVPGSNAQGGPLPHPAYGDQLNEHGVPGVAGEGRAQVTYTEKLVLLSGGEKVTLRTPTLSFVDLAYGQLPANIMTSARIAPALYGLGLLEAIPDAAIVAQTLIQKPTGIKGRVNQVWDIVQGKAVIGRFGWKANMPNLRQQIAGAFVGDMGITSQLFPTENCTSVQTACAKSPSAGSPELSGEQLDQTEFYHLALAAPQSRQAQDANSRELLRHGADLFVKAQCSACHVPELKTGDFSQLPILSDRTIHPYTDLLLHDMGESLADHRPDYLATGNEWRTPPLWGIGLAKKVEPNAGFMHDGRARNVIEAILWHGGEAANSAIIVKSMPSNDRAALLSFIDSL
jgi:CxxC motif-containing protein (DUF1111 family)